MTLFKSTSKTSSLSPVEMANSAKPDQAAVAVENAMESPANGLAAHEESVRSPEEKKAERSFIWKIDFMILPIIATVYFLAALDRSDIGNAAVAGMDEDLNMTPSQLSYCVAFFYVGFLLFELPGALLLRVLTPPIQIGFALLAWGLATVLMTEARNWQTIAGLRVVVGAFEAFVQGAPLYLTFWYKPQELATRGAIFLSMVSIAGSANGLISYAIETTLDGRYGRPAWRWIFLVEGVVSVGFGFVVFLLLPNTPERVKRRFNAAERAIALRRTKEAFNVPHTRPKFNQILVALKDPKTWFFCILNGCTMVSQTTWSQFLPVITESNGYSKTQTQIMTIPVYIAAGVAAIAIGYLSDRYHKRGIFLVGSFATTAAGWLILLLSNNRNLSYAGTFLIGMGSTPSIILEMAWLNDNIVGYTKKGSSLAFMNMTGHVCAIAASFGFRDGPEYLIGKSMGLGAAGLGVVVAAVFMLYLTRQNIKKIAKKDTPEASEMRKKSVEEIFDSHPDFMYSL